MAIWNPWHGCHKTSEGCLHCYMFRRDESIGKVSTIVQKTADFGLALAKRRDGSYVLPPGERVYVCMTSDFFVEEADFWRPQIWDMIRERRDLSVHIITKRIGRFRIGLPEDWGAGWDHVTICATCENQRRADERLPVLLDLPVRHREVICEPMLEGIDLRPGLSDPMQISSRVSLFLQIGSGVPQKRERDRFQSFRFSSQLPKRPVPVLSGFQLMLLLSSTIRSLHAVERMNQESSG